jgi:acyl-CoA dehydrogenase
LPVAVRVVSVTRLALAWSRGLVVQPVASAANAAARVSATGRRQILLLAERMVAVLSWQLSLNDVIDRAVQAHGALGLTDQTPLASMYAEARAAGRPHVTAAQPVHRGAVLPPSSRHSSRPWAS